MFKATFLVALSDLRRRWLQTALVFFVIGAAATVLMLALTVWSASSQPYERALDEANGPHAWFFGGQTDLENIAARQAGVAGTTDIYTVSLNFTVNVGTDRHPVRFWDTGSELSTVRPALLTKGSWLSPEGQNEVVIGAGFAADADFSVGDEIVITSDSGRTALNIVGVAANFERSPYPTTGPAVFHVMPETFERLTEGRTNAWMLGVRLEDAAGSEAFIDEVRAEFPRPPFTVSWQEVRDRVSETNSANLIFLIVFSVFAAVAAGLIIANTIGGQVLAQYREIGLLKSVGFTPGGVSGLLLLENLLIALPAALIGAALGFGLSPLFLNSVADLFNSSAFPDFNPVNVVVVIVAVTAIVAVFTAIPAWRAGRLSTMRALTRSLSADGSQPSLAAKAAAWLRLPPLLVIAIKDAFSRPLRATLTIAALTLAVMTVTFALAVDATLVAARDDPGLLGGAPFELQVTPRTMSDDDTEALIKSRPEVETYVKRAWLEADIVGRDEHINMSGLARDYEEIGYRIADGRMFSGPDEAVLGLGLAGRLNLGVGDTITFLLWGSDRLELPVVGTYVENEDSGRRMMFDVETITDIHPNPRFVSFGLKLAPGADEAAVRQSLLEDRSGAIDVDDLIQDWEEAAQETRREFRTILFSLNGVILSIAVVSLLTTLLFTVRERQRDVGILKSIGLTPVQVVASFMIGSVVFALVASAVGIPAGTLATSALFDYAAKEEGWPAGIGETPSGTWIALTVILTVAVTVIGSALPAISAGRSRVIDALRHE